MVKAIMLIEKDDSGGSRLGQSKCGCGNRSGASSKRSKAVSVDRPGPVIGPPQGQVLMKTSRLSGRATESILHHFCTTSASKPGRRLLAKRPPSRGSRSSATRTPRSSRGTAQDLWQCPPGLRPRSRESPSGTARRAFHGACSAGRRRSRPTSPGPRSTARARPQPGSRLPGAIPPSTVAQTLECEAETMLSSCVASPVAASESTRQPCCSCPESCRTSHTSLGL